MIADNPAARVDLDALEPEERASLLRVLDWGVESRNMPHATALHVLAIADRLAPLLAGRDEARAERDALRERVEAVARGIKASADAEWTTHSDAADLRDMQTANLHGAMAEALDDAYARLRAALADPEAS